MKQYVTLTLLLLSSAAMFSQTVIGRTSYDVQTNNGSKHRITVYDDGKVSALWTGSVNYAYVPPGSPADRGMFFNHYNGVTWGAYPTTRIETDLTGFGEVITVEDHEVALSHYGTGLSIQLYANSTIGGTTWTELTGSDDVTGFWPMAVCPEGTNDIYLVNANANPPTELRFSRSDDGGATWAVLNSTVPFLTAAEGLPGMSVGLVAAAETYQVAVDGSNVYILFGMVNSDLVLLHSASNGAPGTWTNTVIHNFPINEYSGLTQTDVTGDFVTDTISTTDGFHNMIIQDDGTVHVFSGHARIYNDGIGAFWSYNYNNSMNLWHWQTGMDEAELINVEVDWDNADGLNDPDAGIGALRTQYRYAGLTSMPAAAYDEATNHMYIVYTMAIEYTDLFGDPLNFSAQSFRDLFGIYSTDGGSTWSEPVNLSNNASEGKENVYVYAYPKVAGGKIHTVWQRDKYPGTAITDLDPVDTSYIMYNAWDPADFGDVPPPACDATEGPAGLYVDAIGPTSAVLHWDDVPGANQYVIAFWNTADMANVGRKRPNTNMYNIAEGVLTPETTYGFRVKTVCYDEGTISPYSEITYFTTPPFRLGEFSTSMMLYPNPTDGYFNLQLNGYQDKEVDVVILNSVGQVVYQEQLHIGSLVHATNIDLGGIPSGVYQVVVTNNGSSTHQTLMVD